MMMLHFNLCALFYFLFVVSLLVSLAETAEVPAIDAFRSKINEALNLDRNFQRLDSLKNEVDTAFSDTENRDTIRQEILDAEKKKILKFLNANLNLNDLAYLEARMSKSFSGSKEVYKTLFEALSKSIARAFKIRIKLVMRSENPLEKLESLKTGAYSVFEDSETREHLEIIFFENRIYYNLGLADLSSLEEEIYLKVSESDDDFNHLNNKILAAKRKFFTRKIKYDACHGNTFDNLTKLKAQVDGSFKDNPDIINEFIHEINILKMKFYERRMRSLYDNMDHLSCLDEEEVNKNFSDSDVDRPTLHTIVLAYKKMRFTEKIADAISSDKFDELTKLKDQVNGAFNDSVIIEAVNHEINTGKVKIYENRIRKSTLSLRGLSILEDEEIYEKFSGFDEGRQTLHTMILVKKRERFISDIDSFIQGNGDNIGELAGLQKKLVTYFSNGSDQEILKPKLLEGEVEWFEMKTDDNFRFLRRYTDDIIIEKLSSYLERLSSLEEQVRVMFKGFDSRKRLNKMIVDAKKMIIGLQKTKKKAVFIKSVGHL